MWGYHAIKAGAIINLYLFFKQFPVIFNQHRAYYIIEWRVKCHAHHIALIIRSVNGESVVVCDVFTVGKVPLLVRRVPEGGNEII